MEIASDGFVVILESHILDNAQEQIQHLEFSLVTGGKGMERELRSHRLDDNIATELKLILAAGLYPQFAMLDPANNCRVRIWGKALIIESKI